MAYHPYKLYMFCGNTEVKRIQTCLAWFFVPLILKGLILTLVDGNEVLMDFDVARSLAQMLIQELGDAQDLANSKSLALQRSAGFMKLG